VSGRTRPEPSAVRTGSRRDSKRGDFLRAAKQARALLVEHRYDGPLQTLSRDTNALMQEGRGFEPVWTPPGK
jgi:hypothetical protein